MRVIRPTETLADQAYNLLKEAITTGKLKAGESLPEERLAKEMGISRTPLRDALNRLDVEGLIQHQTGKPAVVEGFTKEDSLNYMELRSILEVKNIEKIISKVDEPFIKVLKENLKEQLAAIKEDNYKTFIELDRDFHLLLAQLNQNSEFRKTLHRMNTGVNRAFLILSSTVVQSAEEAYQEHEEIVDALVEKDVILARNKMIVHMNNIEKRFLNYYNKSENK
ncbi:GntR family transcriptional regulator [Pseudogracilibacillus sp. SO30301A]|uniref:GntR family transcriptional regulator n=1 Tax=Pseudogracilibacillus sp. SO30301A TaxID=3098291 RepID=UPI00300E330B